MLDFLINLSGLDDNLWNHFDNLSDLHDNLSNLSDNLSGLSTCQGETCFVSELSSDHWTQVWHRNIWCIYSVFTFIDGIYISPLQYIPTLHASSTNFGLRHSPLLFVVNYWWRDHSTNQNAVICVHSTCSTCTCKYNIDMYFKTFCSTELLHSLSSTFKKIEPCEGNFMHLVRHR